MANRSKFLCCSNCGIPNLNYSNRFTLVRQRRNWNLDGFQQFGVETPGSMAGGIYQIKDLRFVGN